MMQFIFWIFICILTLSAFAFLSIPLISTITKVEPPYPLKVKLLVMFLATGLAGGSIGLYAFIGSPTLLVAPQEPVIDSKLSAMIDEIENHLAKKPQDAEGWQVIAPTYWRINKPKKAFNAYANAIKYGKSNSKNWLGLGKADLMLNNGSFGPMSKVSFTKAHEKSPDNIEAMYFYALMLHNMQNSDEAEQKLLEFIASHDYSNEQIEPLKRILNGLKVVEGQ